MADRSSRINPELCYGATVCCVGHPAVFTFDAEAFTTTLSDTSAPLEALLDAAKRCPAQAIEVRSEGELLWPLPAP